MTRINKETFWIAGLLIFTFLIIGSIKDWNFMDGNSIDIQVHDTFVVFPTSVFFTIIFLIFTIIIYTLRGILSLFKKKWINITLITLLIFVDLFLIYYFNQIKIIEDNFMSLDQKDCFGLFLYRPQKTLLITIKPLTQWSLLFFTFLIINISFKTYRLPSAKK